MMSPMALCGFRIGVPYYGSIGSTLDLGLCPSLDSVSRALGGTLSPTRAILGYPCWGRVTNVSGFRAWGCGTHAMPDFEG